MTNVDPTSNRINHSRCAGSFRIKRENHVQRNFDVVVEKDEEGYYIASVPALP
jgi:hypothetical protein